MYTSPIFSCYIHIYTYVIPIKVSHSSRYSVKTHNMPHVTKNKLTWLLVILYFQVSDAPLLYSCL